MTHGRSLVALVVTLALVMAGAAPTVEAQQRGPGQVVEGAKKVGQGIEQAAKGIATTVAEGVKKAGAEAKPVGDKLRDRAKDFGEALWGGVKYVGRTVQGFFTGK